MATIENKGKAEIWLLYGNRIFVRFRADAGRLRHVGGPCGSGRDAGDEVDPVLREVVVVAPLGVLVNAVGVLHGHWVNG